MKLLLTKNLKNSKMNTLNFFPYYESYLRRGIKTTTFRTTEPRAVSAGSEATLTIGWTEDDSKPLHKILITKIYSKKINDLTSEDFCGESPDCQTPETTRLVLGAIYRKVLSPDDLIWVVKFEHRIK